MIEAVLFDYGLVLSGPPNPAAWEAMLSITGLSDDQLLNAYWAPRPGYDRGTYSGAAYWQVAGQHAGIELTPQQIDSLIAADTRLWTTINPPMRDWAARLQAAGTATGILSNLGDSMTDGVLAAHPWMHDFRHHTFSHTVNAIKPEPVIYQHAAQGLGVSPADILFVDDRQENCEGAIASGMQAIQYRDQSSFESEMRQLGLEALWTKGRFPQ